MCVSVCNQSYVTYRDVRRLKQVDTRKRLGAVPGTSYVLYKYQELLGRGECND